jgi:hypothetical protein
LRERGDGGGCGGGVFGKDNLRIAAVGQDVVFVGAISRINEKIKSAVGILHFREEISFPFRLLQEVADAVAAFGQAKIIERGHAFVIIDREDQRVGELRGVDGVFAVIARVVVSTGNIDFAGVHERIKARGNAAEARRGVARVVRVIGGEIREGGIHGGEGGAGDVGGRGVAGFVNVARERQGIIRAATLMVNAERVSARVERRHAFIDAERK